MATHAKSVAIIGLPGTGKTTFLAALWDVVGSPNMIAASFIVFASHWASITQFAKLH